MITSEKAEEKEKEKSSCGGVILSHFTVCMEDLVCAK